jgi:hypothetical protein
LAFSVRGSFFFAFLFFSPRFFIPPRRQFHVKTCLIRHFDLAVN